LKERLEKAVETAKYAKYAEMEPDTEERSFTVGG
jgi:hypothetical protein